MPRGNWRRVGFGKDMVGGGSLFSWVISNLKFQTVDLPELKENLKFSCLKICLIGYQEAEKLKIFVKCF